MESFVEYCKNYIIDTLPECVDVDVYSSSGVSDLIMEDANMSGTLTYSIQAAVDYIKEWWYECGEFLEHAQTVFDYEYIVENLNPFNNSEAFMLVMVWEGVASILSRVSVLDNYNGKFELTEEIIDTILSEIEGIDEIEW